MAVRTELRRSRAATKVCCVLAAVVLSSDVAWICGRQPLNGHSTAKRFTAVNRARAGQQMLRRAFAVDPLPYELDALVSKGFSAEQLDFHYNKHHKGYATKLNAAADANPDIAKMSITDIIMAKTPQFNLAAQIYNHNFYWKGLSPSGGGLPSGALAEKIEKSFGSFDKFKEEFSNGAVGHFGSGWVWLVADKDGSLKVVQTHDAENPLTEGLTPLLTCDVWEHAFYIDYRNDKAKYVDTFWGAVNWDFVASQLPA